MGQTAKTPRGNRTITVDFQDESTYFRLINDGKAFVECVLAFILSLGFQLTHKSTCNGGDSLMTRHSHYVRIRLGGLTIWRIQCTRCKAVFTVLPHFVLRYRTMRPDVGCIGKKGAPYAASFRGVTNVWDVSRSWTAADRCDTALSTDSKLGTWNVPVMTPIIISSHRPALKAARRCIRPLTVASVQNDPGALKRRLITRRTALSTWPEPMGSLRASSVTYRMRWAWVSR